MRDFYTRGDWCVQLISKSRRLNTSWEEIMPNAISRPTTGSLFYGLISQAKDRFRVFLKADTNRRSFL